MFHTMLLLIAMAIAAGVQGLGDPCLPSNHRSLSDIHRSTGFETAAPEQPLCDAELKPGWYRFHSNAGGQMPEHCVDRMKCGTVVPVWLNGSHPSVGEGVVDRVACAHFDSGDPSGSSCCRQSLKVAVKNCTGFYVYLLHNTPSCPMAYCAGTRAPCPVGQWSPSGFPPNCQPAYPMISTPPTLRGPIVEGKTFRFECHVTLPPTSPTSPTDPQIEVTWSFDGNATHPIPHTTLSGADRVATLEGHLLKGHLGKHVGCQVRTYFPGHPDRTSPWLESNTYWAGIRTQPTHLTISQAAEKQNVTLTSTLPVLCDYDNQCCVIIKLDVDGPSNKVVIPHQCKQLICTEDWEQQRAGESSLTVPIVASKDQIQDGDSDLLLSFEQIAMMGGGPYQNVFSDYVLESVQIEVEKSPAETCTLVTDPHITSIDTDRTFNLYRVGDYTAYHSPSRHFEVQVRTWPCNGGRVTCICGVAIREKDDLIRIHGCDRAYYSRSIGSPDVEVVRPLREGTSLVQSTDGHQIGVYFPSGSEVTVRAYSNYGGHFNLHIAIPSLDKGKDNGGLCGTFDGDATNDFTHRDMATVTRPCSSYCTPEAFSETWKNDHSTSLFRMVPPALGEEYSPKYCQCNQGSSQINCTARGDIGLPVLPPCDTCQNRTFLVANWTTTGNRRREVGGPVYEDVDEVTHAYDPDDFPNFLPATPRWPTPSGITLRQAELRCRQALQTSQIWAHCLGQSQHAANTIDSCKEDVLFGDSFESLDSLVASFTTDCQAQLAKDPDNYVTDPQGQVTLKPEVSTDVCSAVCLQHGTCDKGRCVCHHGYTGDTCQLLDGQGPQLLQIRGSALCNINLRPCRKVFIDADNLEMTELLACKVQEILADRSVSPQASMEEAVFMSGTKLMCFLPDAAIKTEQSVRRYQISATMDGVTYGTAVNLTVFDSVCQNCSDTECTQLPGTCLIKDLCFADGDLNPLNEGQICTNGSSEWTNLYPMMTPPLLSGPSTDGSMECYVGSPEKGGGEGEEGRLARYKVSWFVDGHPYPRQLELNVPQGVERVIFNLLDLPHSGKLECKMASYYTGSSVVSPRLVSNPVDLSTTHV